MWSIDRTEQVEEWVKNLDEDAKEAIFKNLLILREIGPSLGRPHVDSIKKSRHKNMKELRIQNRQRLSESYLPLILTERQSFLQAEISGATGGFMRR